MKKDKYLQIFNYLLEFSKLRSNPVRNIENSEIQYPEKIWFADIPQHQLFESVTFSNYNQDSDYFIKIKKPKEEPLQPKFQLPNSFRDWIIEESLIDEENLPTLNTSFVKDSKIESLSDYPQVEKEFKIYLDTKWIDDLESYKKEYSIYETKLAEFEKLNDIYKHFFSIYNKAQQFGEEYELIIGAGLLKFKESDNTPLICRHIFTSKVEIIFEILQKESFIKIVPNTESDIQIETDAIIDLFEQFESESIIEAEVKCNDFIKEKNGIGNLFEEDMKVVIQIFADRLSRDGQFINELELPKEILKKPVIYFAPALILRKRNTRSFTALYEKIIKDISDSKENIDIPTINELVGFYQQLEVSSENIIREVENIFKDETIYFPKKYNDEQIEIVHKTRRNNKILVQGPPGTGKSHTIANLICHLLANGKRILVTAYTKRALEVLKNQLPEEFKNLTVNLLSGDTASIQDLESSVNSINDELSKANLNEYKKEIEKIEIELAIIKEDIATTKNELIKAKEKSTRSRSFNNYYKGTPIQIAERIEKESGLFSWYKDSFVEINNLELIGNLEIFISLTEYYKHIDCSMFDFKIPEKDKILPITELKQYQSITNEIRLKYPSRNYDYTITCQDFQELKNQLKKLLQFSTSIEHNAFIFKTELISGYPSDISVWKDKLYSTNTLLAGLSEKKLKELERSIEISYPEGGNLIQFKNDAQILYQYLIEGNNLSGILFNFKKLILKKDIKEKLYFIDNIKVNGSCCDTSIKFENVLEDIKVKQDFEELGNIWEVQQVNKSKSYYDQVKYYKKLKEDAENLLSVLKEFNEVKSQIENISSIRISHYESKVIAELIDETDFNVLVKHIKLFHSKIDDIANYFLVSQYHPIVNTLIRNLESIDPIIYDIHLAEIDHLNIEKDKYTNYKNLQILLQKHFPIMLSEILQNTFDLSNINQLEKAIFFKHARNEIAKLLSDEYEGLLSNELAELELREEKLIAKTASKKAWFKVIENLTNNNLLQKHLQAWVSAEKKIGKTGKGKRALKFRKIAQNQMTECKDSVPCWIMPLYKVAETINPEQGMYDYVIIDEASQVGPDAIFLLYISKNIIIVGDDKQVSPEYVGVDADTMTPHIKRHLKDIPFSDFYGTEFSFFDHAKRFCNGITVLREHFRCMPEIIEFSNKYFYAPDGKGLYPLKQYSENRLEPLKNVYCQNGYIEGQYQNITNKVEAESITNIILELVKDERYKNKTFGVITLQGNKQSSIIEALLLKEIGENEYHNRKIICGNSASFQGDERDIVFLSLVTAHNHNRAALVKPEDERRFNVAMSRAKEQVWLFHSVQPDDLSNTNDLRFKLLCHFYNHNPQPIPLQRTIERTIKTQPEPFESWFEVDVFNDIISKGYRVIPQYEVAKGKYRIDLVLLLPNGSKIAIECDGDKYHGPEEYNNDLMRQKVLERCGWLFFRVRGSEYYSNREKALEPLWRIIGSYNNEKEESIVLQNHEYNNEIRNNKNNCEIIENDETDLVNVQIHVPIVKLNKLENSTTQPHIQRIIVLGKEKIYCETAVAVLIETANWLIKKGRITASLCPIKLQSRGNSYLINTRPIHEDGRKFQDGGAELLNNLYIEKNWSSSNCINKAKELLFYCGISEFDLSE
jgi:very-short-patch-repair endonuclease/DNA polymerase III delta prime subunit